MNQKSSLPPGHFFVIVTAAAWNTFRIFGYKVSLSLIAIASISFSFWLYVSDSLYGVLQFIAWEALAIAVVGLFIFLSSLSNVRIRKRFLRYKVRRQQILKNYYEDPSQRQKIDAVIDYYQQHLRHLDEDFDQQFGLGT